MKKNYVFLLLLFLTTLSNYAQDCISQKAVSDDVICLGENASIILSNSESGVNYQLRDGLTDIGMPIIGNGGDISFTISPSATTNYSIFNVDCGITYTDLGVVTVKPLPVISASSPDITRCSGASLGSFGISSNIAGTTYSWTRDNTTNITGIADSGTGIPIGFITNITSVPQVVTFTFTPSANGCTGTPILVTATVNPKPTGTASLPTQTICSGTDMTEVTFNSPVAGTTFNWVRNNTINVTGIADSGTGSINGNLTNTASTNQTVTFTVTPVADGCIGSNFTFTVIVNPRPTIVSGTPTVERCSGTTVGSLGITSNVSGTTYVWTRDNSINVTGPADNGTGLPTGTLTNITNVAQTVHYTITGFYNGCEGNTINIDIIVHPRPIGSATPLSSTVCSGDVLSIINLSSTVSNTTFTWTRNNTINVSGPESGTGDISGVWVNNVASNQSVTFTITPTTPECAGSNFTTTITVYPTPTVTASLNSQTVCSSKSMTTITFTGITSTVYNWTRDKVVEITGIPNSGSGPISGVPVNTTTVAQTITYTVTPVRNGCSGVPITVTVTVNPASVGGAVTVSQPAVTPVVNSFTHCHVGSGVLYLSGQTGNVVEWQYSTNAGITWTSIAGTAGLTSYNYSNITQSTLYRAVIKNEPNCALAYSKGSMINIIPNIKPSPVVATPSVICAGQSSVLSSQSGYATSGAIASGGTFSNANPTGWQSDNCNNCLNSGGSNSNPGPWQLSATNGALYSGIPYTSIGKFAIAHGEINSTYLYTPVFNTFGLTDATLTFTHAYNFLAGAKGEIQIQINGAGPWITLAQYNGPATLGPYNGFAPGSVDLSDYIGQPNLRIRFHYYGLDTVVGNTNGSSWAVDNIQIPDVPTNLSTQWVDAISGEVVSTSASMTVTPSVTTTYAVTSFLNGCNSFGTAGTAYVTVTVNQRPTAVISENQYVCYNGTATFSVAFTGTAPWKFTYTDGTTTSAVITTSANPYIFTRPNMTATKTYTITSLSDAKCSALPGDITGSATVTVLDGIPGKWTGLVSNDWFDCRNWERGLPTPLIDAWIPTGTIRMPIIDPSISTYASAYANIAHARDMIIENGASVTMANGSNLEVRRDWKNSGVFNPGMGTVSLTGNTAGQIQTINEGISLAETFYNLTLKSTGAALGAQVVDAFKLTVKNNLALESGKFRLIGEAQLLQEGLVANTSTGSGVLLRDQQGTKSSFHYNHWTSPVSNNNTSYTISEVLRDGTNSATNPFSIITISFGDGYNYADGPLTSPIKISNRWLYKYTSVSTSYYSWQAIGSTGSLKVGEGYTMKGVTGTAPNTDYQNYTFIGKPNNGTINLNIALNQSYLVGNPYPSALDADEFIKDNIKDGGRASNNVFNGALYFLDHFGGTSHYLAQYVGGYATYSLMGGVVAISNDPMINNNNASGSKIPKRYIPVGQAFFIQTDLDPNLASSTNDPNLTSPITGGPVIFKNSQRAFKTEATGNSIFIRNTGSPSIQDDTRAKIRLEFESANGIRRELLVGADPTTSNLFDLGYDAPMIDVNNDDMFWKIGSNKFVIQGVPNFDPTQIIPLGIKISSSGNHKIKLKTLENMLTETNIYLHDSETDTYYDLIQNEFNVSLGVGEYPNRFSLRFANELLNNNSVALESGLLIYNDNQEHLNIKNLLQNTIVNKVVVFNLLGQKIATWNTENETQNNIQFPVEHISSGTYIVKVYTSNGILSQKVAIK